MRGIDGLLENHTNHLPGHKCTISDCSANNFFIILYNIST